MPAPTITYRTAGLWGAGKGADLDAVEIDNNFFSIAQSIQSLIDTPPTPNNIASIELVNTNQLVITLDDYTTFGPFDLPLATFQDRGEWAPTTNYAYADIFTHLNSLYLVLQPHTSSRELQRERREHGRPVLSAAVLGFRPYAGMGR
jgi:hypothetical protein